MTVPHIVHNHCTVNLSDQKAPLASSHQHSGSTRLLCVCVCTCVYACMCVLVCVYLYVYTAVSFLVVSAQNPRIHIPKENNDHRTHEVDTIVSWGNHTRITIRIHTSHSFRSHTSFLIHTTHVLSAPYHFDVNIVASVVLPIISYLARWPNPPIPTTF